MTPIRSVRRLLVEGVSLSAAARAGMFGLQPPWRIAGIVEKFRRYGLAGASVGVAAMRHGSRVAFIDERGSLSFTDLDQRSNALANALLARGVGAAPCIGMVTRNHRWALDSLYACSKLGARTVFLNTEFAAPQLRDVCAREGVDLVIHDEEFTAMVSGADLRHGTLLAWTEEPPGEGSVEQLITTGDPGEPPRPAQKQKIVMLTSGTTGLPKGAPRNLGASFVIPGGLLSKIPYRSGQHVYVAAPFFHAWGLLNASIAMSLGSTIVTRRRFDAQAVVADLEAYRCQGLVVVPTMLARITALGPQALARHDTSSLRIIASAGSQLPAALATQAMDLFGDVVYNLYGSTEVAFATIATPADMRAAPGCVGSAPYGTTVRILDDDGNEVPTGVRGRIFVANGVQFEGYTGGGGKQVIRGLMSSGDVGHFDGAGRLFVDGRDDEMIISGGENVFPREIEELLATHDSIAAAALIGVPDEEFGQRLEAYVVAVPGRALGEDDVKAFVRANLARYKVPRAVHFRSELPTNATGKVMKRLLTDATPSG